MQRQHPDDRGAAAEESAAVAAGGAPDAAPRSADIHVRNYDHERAYWLDLRVESRGEVAFSASYRLEPGAFLSEPDVLPAGEYEVTAALDRGRTAAATTRLRVDDRPGHTAVVEAGNWNVTVVEGY